MLEKKHNSDGWKDSRTKSGPTIWFCSAPLSLKDIFLEIQSTYLVTKKRRKEIMAIFKRPENDLNIAHHRFALLNRDCIYVGTQPQARNS